jgi:hypothetical protein
MTGASPVHRSAFPRRAAAAALVLAVSALAVSAAHAQSASYRILAVGDIMMGSNFPQPIMDPRVRPGGNPAAVLGAPLARLLRSGDIVFGNMEGTIHTRSAPSKTCHNPKYCYVFRSPPFHATYLRSVGFNMLSVANNHAGDFLEPGRLATYATLKKAGFTAAGFDKPGYRTAMLRLRDGTRVGLIAFGHNPGLLWITDLKRAARLVRGLARRTDFTIVSFHGGAEGARMTHVPRKTEMFLGENRGDVWRFAHTVVDAGADLVFGSGPHVPRAVDIYKRRFIVYSLGNFWTYGRFNLRGVTAMAPIADVTVDKHGRVLAARIHSAAQRMPGGPRLDPSGAAAKTIARLTAQDFPKGRLRFAPDGTITGPGIGGKGG